MTLRVPRSMRWIWARAWRIDSGVGVEFIPGIYVVNIDSGKKLPNTLSRRFPSYAPIDGRRSSKFKVQSSKQATSPKVKGPNTAGTDGSGLGILTLELPLSFQL
jgi:hypothetical protein